MTNDRKMTSSTKTISISGDAHVVTISLSPIKSHTGSKPKEPSQEFVLQPGTLGLTFDKDKPTMVVNVAARSSAASAGILPNMVLLTVSGKSVVNSADVNKVLEKVARTNKSYRCVFRLVEPKVIPTPTPMPTPEPIPEPEPTPVVVVPDTGKVTLHYNMYSEMFDISLGSLPVATVDSEYCLSDIMPGCQVKLSSVKTDTRGTTLKHPELLFADRSQFGNPYVTEDENKCFTGLRDGREYWVYIIEDPVQEQEDRAKMAKLIAEMDVEETGRADDYSEACREMGITESCSCIEGNPCVNELCCRDWYRRFEIAAKNGWKGH
ncbi:hypothetical protein TrST_g1462 [Triparma strigata]|uniref:PDZ domain-containing protein n=1 Tax=Triparma strigata TaxID=1606541 RepID=A0A9W7DQQ1_9STRA|nr:hypothetical protein TrST_g1462 [Triparma strigata]